MNKLGQPQSLEEVFPVITMERDDSSGQGEAINDLVIAHCLSGHKNRMIAFYEIFERIEDPFADKVLRRLGGLRGKEQQQ